MLLFLITELLYIKCGLCVETIPFIRLFSVTASIIQGHGGSGSNDRCAKCKAGIQKFQKKIPRPYKISDPRITTELWDKRKAA